MSSPDQIVRDKTIASLRLRFRRWNAAAVVSVDGGDGDHLAGPSQAGSGSHGYGAILAVTHNFVIGGMIPRALGIGLQVWPKFDSTNAGVTRIGLTDGRVRLVSFNESM